MMIAKLKDLIKQLCHLQPPPRLNAWSEVIKTLPQEHESERNNPEKKIAGLIQHRVVANRKTDNQIVRHQNSQSDTYQKHQRDNHCASQSITHEDSQVATKTACVAVTEAVTEAASKAALKAASKTASKIDRQSRTQRSSYPTQQHDTDDAYDDRRVPRGPGAVPPAWSRSVKNNNNISASQAALALLYELTLDQAVKIIDALPSIKPTLINLELEERALQRICAYLRQQNFTQQPAHYLPLLTLLARQLGHLNNSAQRDLAMDLLTQSLKILPQIEVVETLSTTLASLPAELQQRALVQIEEFLWRTADIAQSHVDILLGLTDAVRVDCCRKRAGALIATGLERLRNEPELCAQIRRRLVLAYCIDEHTMHLQLQG